MKKSTCIIKLASTFLIAAVMVLLTGCIKQKILIKVKPDGTGNIVVKLMFNKDIAAAIEKQIDAQRQKMAEQGMDTTKLKDRDPFYNEQQIARGAAEFGENIKFVKATKIDDASGRGYIAEYSFEKIEDVKLDLKKISSPVPNMGQQAQSDNAIKFALTKGDVSTLKITIPKAEKDATVEEDTNEVIEPTPLTKQEKTQMMQQGNMFGLTGKEETKEEVFRKMFGGMNIDIDVEVDGDIVKSDASFPDEKNKNCFTLFALDFGVLLESDKICSKLANNKGADFFSGIMNTKAKTKGLKLEEKSEVTVEFKK